MAPDSGENEAGAPFKVFRVAPIFFLALLSVSLLRLPVARAAQGSHPLAKDDVLNLLTNDVDPSRVAEIAKERGVAFEMTSAAEKQLRDAGADDRLIKVLRDLGPKPKAEPPASSGAPLLLIQATPGGAQVYIDDEPLGTTSPEGRLKLSRLAAGEHKVRLALTGYQDYEQSVTLAAGQTAMVSTTLAARQAAQAQPAAGSSVPQANASQVASSLLNPTTNLTSAGQTATPPSKIQSFSVVHDHGSSGQDYCMGFLTLGNGMIQYRGTNGLHSFEFPVSAIKEAKKNGVYLVALGAFHIRLKKGTNYNFVQLNSAAKFQPPDALLAAIEQEMAKAQ